MNGHIFFKLAHVGLAQNYTMTPDPRAHAGGGGGGGGGEKGG